MSFSSDTKNEITRGRAGKRCCETAEVAGLVRACGSVFAQGNGRGIVMTTENPAVARRIKTLLNERFGVAANLLVGDSGFGSNRHIYELKVVPEKGAERVLSEIGMCGGQGDSAQIEQIYSRKCCKKAYLKGLFLGAGTISEPEKGYNLEIVCADENTAFEIRRLMNGFDGIHARVRQRRGNAVVYIKTSEQIKDMLNIIGAHTQLLKFENVRVLKDVRNRTNRINNCDHANLDRSIGAAERQIADINQLRTSGKFDDLPDDLRDIAAARLAHPEVSLSELGELFDPPIGKSAVHARLRKLSEYTQLKKSF
jgi:DNA-binding protein WhiA